MSDTETVTETTETDATTEAPPVAADKPKKAPRKRAANPLAREVVVAALAEAGLQVDESNSAFASAGTKKGPRLTFPKSGEKISRLYVYCADVQAEGLVSLTEEQRKEQRLGNVRAYVDFDSPKALDAVKAAARVVAEAAAKEPAVEATPAA